MFFFASDLHGHEERYETLIAAIAAERPAAVLLGGDLLPSRGGERFIGWLSARFDSLRRSLADAYPEVLLIFGNDDARVHEKAFLEQEAAASLWTVLNSRCRSAHGHPVYGYPYVPPTPFRLKDWERFDVGHFVDPGAISPEEGVRSVDADPRESRYATIESDLRLLTGDDDVSNSVFLFHTPPYQTFLDRAALDGRSIDHVPLDVHVGSIAVRRFIEARQPRVTLHGHVHESARLTGRWSDCIGQTVMLSGAHDGPELALVRFDPGEPEKATRELL